MVRQGAERLLSLLRAFLPDRMKDVKSISFNPTELLGADENNNLYSDKILFCFLELSKFAAPKIGQLKDMNFPDDRHKWAYILKNMGQMEEQDLSQEDEVFRGLFEDGRFSKLTKMEKKVYKKSVLDYADVQDAIRCTREVSLKEGLEQGLLEGREEGREEGRADERRQLARNMIDEGLDFAFVARITGLSEEELAQLVASSE